MYSNREEAKRIVESWVQKAKNRPKVDSWAGWETWPEKRKHMEAAILLSSSK